MPATSAVYRFLVHLGHLAVRTAASSPKARRAVALRDGVLDRLEAWGRTGRDPARPLAWFHAPSVGEGLQARAVIQAFRARHPDWQVAYTFFSPSAERFAASVGADVTDILPLDRARDVGRALDALRPALLVFAKLDLWPELATRAAARGVPVALVAGTVRPGSGRLRGPVRALLAPGYATVARAGAVAADDAARLALLGVPRDRIVVTGDPRHDSVATRVAAVRPDDPLLHATGGAPALVAGSTWPPDEDVLLQAFTTVRAAHPDARLVLVPHEPTPAALARIAAQAARLGLPAPVRVQDGHRDAPLQVEDRMGVLAALYGAGTCAWVGGGFGTAGLHSVLEPAAWGVPVAFGPRHTESRDAVDLLAAGGASAVRALEADAAARDAAAIWQRWLGDEAARRAQGETAKALVARGAGASERSVDLLDEVIGGRAHRPPS